MRVAVIGAGALGCAIAARIGSSGEDVSVLARGANLAAIEAKGVALKVGGEVVRASPRVSQAPEALGKQDVVIVAVKAHALDGIADDLHTLMGPRTVLIPMVNGVPWWFLEQLRESSKQHAETINTLLPTTAFAQCVRSDSVIGAVLHGSFSVEEPGMVRNHSRTQLILGEPDGGRSDRLDQVVAMLVNAGFSASTTDNIRKEVWFKLLGNIATGPLCVLTGTSTSALLNNPHVERLMGGVVLEVLQIGQRLNIEITDGIHLWRNKLESLGDIRPSMLQDFEAKRPLEIDAIVTSVVALGSATGIPTPLCSAVLGLLSLKASQPKP